MSLIIRELWMVPDLAGKLQELKGGHVVVYIAVAYLAYLILHRLVLQPYVHSPLRNLPGPPAENLILGDYRAFITSEPGFVLHKWANEYGPVVHMVGPVGIERLMFLKPDALQEILVKDWLQYPRPAFLRIILGLVSGYGLLTVTGDEHKQMKKAMNPAFSLSNLMAQNHMYWESINGLVELLKAETDTATNGAVLPVYNWMSKVTLDILCETAFGYKIDALHNPNNELGMAYERLAAVQTGSNFFKLIVMAMVPGGARLLGSDWAYHSRKLLGYLPFLRDVSTLIESLYIIRQVSKRMLEEKVQEAAQVSDAGAKRDIMSILVRTQKTERESRSECYMNEQAMMDQVLRFLGAGHGTVAAGLTWALWLLANDKVSQQKLREELTPVMMHDSRPDFRTLKDLKWLDCVVMESLRVMPPVPLTARIAKETGMIDGIVIPEGTLLYIPIRAVNTSKATWGEDAEEFRPARWLNLPKNYHPTYSMMSFIAGPHSCIGKTMAILEMKAILAGLITSFEFDVEYEGQQANHTTGITMKPTDGMPLRVRRAHSS